MNSTLEAALAHCTRRSANDPSPDPATVLLAVQVAAPTVGNILIYDCETVKPVLDKGAVPLPDVQYCGGWGDHVGMGISVIAAYQVNVGYRIFLADNFGEFIQLAQNPGTLMIGWNNRSFDDKLIAACLGVELPEERSYDLRHAVIRAAGENPVAGVHNRGFSLGKVADANGIHGKRGHGAMAPILWQQGKIGAVIDYALGDIMMTKKLLEFAGNGRLLHPADSHSTLAIEGVPII